MRSAKCETRNAKDETKNKKQMNNFKIRARNFNAASRGPLRHKKKGKIKWGEIKWSEIKGRLVRWANWFISAATYSRGHKKPCTFIHK